MPAEEPHTNKQSEKMIRSVRKSVTLSADVESAFVLSDDAVGFNVVGLDVIGSDVVVLGVVGIDVGGSDVVGFDVVGFDVGDVDGLSLGATDGFVVSSSNVEEFPTGQQYEAPPF